MHCPNSSYLDSKQQLSTAERHYSTDWRHRQHYVGDLLGLKFLAGFDAGLAIELSRPELVKA
jgi:hypothetical protein